MSASWLQSSCLMASTFSVQLHHLPQTQALRSCHPWTTGAPLGTEAPPQPGLECWSSAVVTAMRTSASAVGAAAVVRLWAETTAQTTCSCGGCEPALCGPGWTQLSTSPQPACLFPSHTQTLSRVSAQGHTVWILSHLCGSIPGRTLPARPRPLLPMDCPSVPIWDQGGDVGAAQDLCP